jgi:exosortase
VSEPVETQEPNPNEAEGLGAPDDSLKHHEHGESHSPVWRRSDLLVVVIVTISVALVYSHELRWLIDTWIRDPNYSHGFLVFPVALFILWRRLRAVDGGPTRSRPVWWAWLLIIGLLVGRAFLYELGNEWSEAFTLWILIPCLILTLGGWALIRRAWPAVVFLGFMFPLPARLNETLAQPLQALATSASSGLLRITGLWTIVEGNVIIVDNHTLEVAEACNGLSMLMTLAATVAAMTMLFPVVPWRRVVLLVSIVPVALLSNVLRIVVTAWCYHRFGPEVGGRFAHDMAGWLMMPLALVLTGLELFVLNFLIVEEEVEIKPTLLGRPIAKSKPAPRREVTGPNRTEATPSPTPTQ